METLKQESEQKPKPQVVKDVWDAILNDKWMWIATWGKPRTGKTTLDMKLAFEVYHDWDQVLQCFVFNISGLLYKIKKGTPCRIFTRNMLHNRVPLIILDDFGANSNKAKTQHEPAYDIFKGAFDTFGTKVAVLCANMNTPNEITLQLQEKYTHELYVTAKGKAKYDVVDWNQNFGGWQPQQDKIWIQSFRFTEVPMDVYKEYDEMRMSLVDELDQQIQDRMAETQMETVLTRLMPIDVDFMEILQHQGMISKDWMQKPENDKYREVLVRCKARSLVVPIRKGTNYYYDLTDFGYNVLQACKKVDAPQHVTPVTSTSQKSTISLQ